MKLNLPSFKHREIRMYVYLGIHILLLGLIITNAALPASSTYWMNDFASNIINRIIDTFNGTTPVYPNEIKIDGYNHNVLTYHYENKNKFYVLEGDSMTFHIDMSFPENTQESLKYKDLYPYLSDSSKITFDSYYDKYKSTFAIKGLKVSQDNYAKLVSPNGLSIPIYFDVVPKIVPEAEDIYISNTNPKIGSSFFINSHYLEHYQDAILADDYSINTLENVVYGGLYYSNMTRNAVYYPSLSESNMRRFFDLSGHQYISDDPHVHIDESLGIVSISDGARIGNHVITSNFGGEVSFTVKDEYVSPISISELKIKSTSDLLYPMQSDSGYIGQTIQLDNLDVLKDHAFVVNSSDTSVAKANIKRHESNGLFDNRGEIFVSGNNAGECDLTVYLYGHDDIKLTHHVVNDTVENQFNYRVRAFIDDELYQGQTLEVLKKYKIKVCIYDLNTETYNDVTNITFSKVPDRLIMEETPDGTYYVTFLNDTDAYLNFEYAYNGYYHLAHRLSFNTVDNNKGNYSDVDKSSVRKVIGHGMMHFFCALFLILFLLLYFKGHKFRYYSFVVVAVSSLLLGGLTELIQLFVPGRYPSIYDVIFDYLFALGALLIVGACHFIYYIIKKKRSKKQDDTINEH